MTHLVTCAQQREQAIDDCLVELTPRERSLVRDAAGMGYVQGRMDERAKAETPTDTVILRLVIDAVLLEERRYAVLRGRVRHYTEPGAES
uniref:hypothetical protein n=1 Tax=Streptomyces sp. CA-141956 TaxID=3240051 RepID=UPI003F4931B1